MNIRVDNGPVVRDRPISIAILAMGGQGGGVLADWIVALAESQGYAAQTTSVPGVAQRTGATIYYVEFLPSQGTRRPIFSLMPTPGDVDIIIAAEWMEAGRSILRGLATPDKTLLIASTHRAMAMAEKMDGGDGAADSGLVLNAADVAVKRLIAFDMQAIAEQNGSVVSAALFGALAASNATPFSKEAFTQIVSAGGKGVKASLATFEASFARSLQSKGADIPPRASKDLQPAPDAIGIPEIDALLERMRRDLPEPVWSTVYAGLSKCIDYQDAAYGGEYLDFVSRAYAVDKTCAVSDTFALTERAARYGAAAFCYDDPIRVADLKTRPARFARIRQDMSVSADAPMNVSEFFHPRGEEICASLPARWARAILASPRMFRLLDSTFNRGRRIQSNSILGFTALYCVSALRPARRRLLRHATETQHREAWLSRTLEIAPKNYDLACELLRARKLVKGYSDTHARGNAKFDRVMNAAADLVGREDGSAWAARLIRAAEKDEDGVTLDGALRTLKSL